MIKNGNGPAERRKLILLVTGVRIRQLRFFKGNFGTSQINAEKPGFFVFSHQSLICYFRLGQLRVRPRGMDQKQKKSYCEKTKKHGSLVFRLDPRLQTCKGLIMYEVSSKQFYWYRSNTCLLHITSNQTRRVCSASPFIVILFRDGNHLMFGWIRIANS